MLFPYFRTGPVARSSRCERMDTLSSVTHAITLKGARITWAILAGIKTVENRSIRLQPGWVALHTGVGKLDARRSEEIAALCPGIPAEANLPHGALVGAMFVDRAVSVEHCRGSPAEAWASGPVCNVISKVVELDEPIEAKGALGLWKVDADILPRLQTALAGPPVRTNDASRMPPPGCTVPIPKRVRPTTADSSGGSASSSNKKSKVSSSGATGMTLDAYFVTAKAAASSTAAELAGAMGSAAATAAAPPPPPPLAGAMGSAAARLLPHRHHHHCNHLTPRERPPSPRLSLGRWQCLWTGCTHGPQRQRRAGRGRL